MSIRARSFVTELTRPRRILVIHDTLPHFDRGGSEFRIMQLLRVLSNLNHELTYFARNGTSYNTYAPPLEALGVSVHVDLDEELGSLCSVCKQQSSFESVVKDSAFDVAILFTWFWSSLSVLEQYLDQLRRLSPNTVVISLTDDRHWLRIRRAANLSHSLSGITAAEQLLKREEECYRSVD